MWTATRAENTLHPQKAHMTSNKRSKKHGRKMNYRGGKKTEPKRVLSLKDNQKKNQTEKRS